MKPPTLKALTFRLADKRDIPDLADIERYSEDGLLPGEIAELMAGPSHIRVCDLLHGWDRQLAGYVAYAANAKSTYLMRVAVHPAFRRAGVGRAIMRQLDTCLTSQRQVLLSDVDEYDVAAQCFLRACGWRCVRQHDGEYRFVRTWRRMMSERQEEHKTWLSTRC